MQCNVLCDVIARDESPALVQRASQPESTQHKPVRHTRDSDPTNHTRSNLKAQTRAASSSQNPNENTEGTVHVHVGPQGSQVYYKDSYVKQKKTAGQEFGVVSKSKVSFGQVLDHSEQWCWHLQVAGFHIGFHKVAENLEIL